MTLNNNVAINAKNLRLNEKFSHIKNVIYTFIYERVSSY